MKYFSEIPEGQAIICTNGVYRQSKIAERDGKLYVKYGAGYVRMLQGGGTSHPKARWFEIDAGEGSYSEKQGYVYYAPAMSVAAE